MPDECDVASVREELDRRLAISAARQNGSTLAATGFCLSCGAQLDEGARFCDKDCRDDYERVQRAAKRNGHHA